MSKLISRFASPRVALSLMAAVGFWTALAAFWPGGGGGGLFHTRSFFLIAAALAAGLLVSLGSRLPRASSVRALGSVALHLSLVLLVLGGAYNHIQAREARLEIIEGQVQPLPGSNYSLRLERLHPFYRAGGSVKGDAAEVTVFNECYPVMREIVHVNRPLKFAGYRLYLDLHGFAPLMEVSGNGTGETYKGFVSLKTSLGPQVYYWRDIAFPGVALKASAVLRPSPDGPFPRAPRVKFVARAPGEGMLYAGEVSPDQPFKAGAYSVSVGEIRYWAAFQVRRDPGLPLIFASFWLAVLGAAAALLPRLARG